MKNIKISQTVLNSVLCLLDKYTDFNMPPVDYLRQHERELPCQEDDQESVVEIFLSVMQHYQFLVNITNYFYCLVKRKVHNDRNFLILLSHLIIFVINSSNKDEIIQIMHKQKLKVINFLKYFCRKSLEEDIFLAGCQYFEEDYVLNKMLPNITENKALIKGILSNFELKPELQKDAYTRDLTSEDTPFINANLRLSHLIPPPPPNTPQKPPSPKPPPDSTYNKPKEIKTLAVIKEQNKKASLKLLEYATKAADNLSAPRGNQHICTCPNTVPKPVVHLKIVKSDVPVKKNAATILREASRVIKEEEKEIQKVKELVCGAANYTKYEKLLEDVRACEEQSRLMDVEKKHLLGLLTREEAILARQSILQANKKKKAQIDLERKEIEEVVKMMRQKHEEKVKDMIEKTQQIQNNIAEKKKNIIDEKQRIAHEMTETNKLLYEERLQKQKDELEKRIEIIKEIKALSSIKYLQTNKFDPTETMNLGLLCEMSLTELQERLIMNKANLNEEIQERQVFIKKQRQRQQQFLADTQQFLETSRKQKNMIKKVAEESVKEVKVTLKNSEVVELREKLQKARLKRIELQKKSDHPAASLI